MNFTKEDLGDLREARGLLEYPGLTARIADVIGMPLEKGFKLLPENWKKKVDKAVSAALYKGLEFAIFTMREGKSPSPVSSPIKGEENRRAGGKAKASPYESGDNECGDKPGNKYGCFGAKDGYLPRNLMHKILVTASGAGGGMFGLVSLPVELPISTCLILRSVADIARAEGHDLSRIETRLSCLEVLALGGPSSRDDSAETGYWSVRAALAKAVSEAASFVAEKGIAEKSAPPLVRLITAVASRFGFIVSEEVAAKSVPVIGALAGGAINLLFMAHFQDMARGHFIIKRLESKYGNELVMQKYGE